MRNKNYLHFGKNCRHVLNLSLEVGTWNEVDVNQKDKFGLNQTLGNVSKFVDRIKVLKMKMNKKYRILLCSTKLEGWLGPDSDVSELKYFTPGP